MYVSSDVYINVMIIDLYVFPCVYNVTHFIPPSLVCVMMIYNYHTVSPLPSFPTLGDAFTIVKQPCAECSAVVVETPADQDGVSVYIALDSDSYGHTNRPGNGGIRLLNYKSYVVGLSVVLFLLLNHIMHHEP